MDKETISLVMREMTLRRWKRATKDEKQKHSKLMHDAKKKKKKTVDKSPIDLASG